MTKNVRIENADNSKYAVVVEIWDQATQTCLESRRLENPTDLATVAIWDGRYLVVREE